MSDKARELVNELQEAQAINGLSDDGFLIVVEHLQAAHAAGIAAERARVTALIEAEKARLGKLLVVNPPDLRNVDPWWEMAAQAGRLEDILRLVSA